MDRFQALRVFSQVVETGSFSAAAARLGLSARIAPLVEEGFDGGVRIGARGSDNIVARKLGNTRLVPCASPAYLQAQGAPQIPEDLASHNCFTYEYVSPRNLWRFRDAAGA